jgi:hypothetical protein
MSPSLATNLSAFCGFCACVAFVILVWAKGRVERNLIRLAALQAYAGLAIGKDLSFDTLKQIYVEEMKGITGISGGLVSEEAREIIRGVKRVARADTALDEEKRKWLLRAAERSLPVSSRAPRVEYIFALIILFFLLRGLQAFRGFAAAGTIPSNEYIKQSASVIMPSVLIALLAGLMVKWALRSSARRKAVENSVLKRKAPW